MTQAQGNTETDNAAANNDAIELVIHGYVEGLILGKKGRL